MLDIKNCEKTGWLYDYRRGGRLLDIEKKNRQDNDIWVGDVLQYKVKRNNNEIIVDELKEDDIEINRFPHPEKERVCRGGKTIKAVNTKEKQKGDQEEYKYLKWEVKEESGICVECTEQEKKDYFIEKIIKPRLKSKYMNTEEAITNPTENAENYQNELATIEALSYEELKKYKVVVNG
jgi:hypothetical protein